MKRLILNIPIGNNASMHNHVSATIEASFWLLIASAVKLMALYHGKYSMTSALGCIVFIKTADSSGGNK